MVAALFCARKREIIAQQIEQRAPRIDQELVLAAVDVELNREFVARRRCGILRGLPYRGAGHQSTGGGYGCSGEKTAAVDCAIGHCESSCGGNSGTLVG